MKKLIQAACAGLAALTLALPAFAQGTDRGFNLQNFLVAPGQNNYLTVEGASIDDGLRLRVGGFLNYQYSPLRLRECDRVEGDRCADWSHETTPLVENHLALDVIGAFSFGGIFEIGLVVPVILYQGGEDLEPAAGYDGVESPSTTTGLGDLRVHLKLDLLHGVFGSENEMFGLAFVPVISFPTAKAVNDDAFMGDSSVSVHPKLAFDVNFERARLGLNAGYLWREEAQFYLAEIGPRLSYGAAAEFFFNDKWSGILEGFGTSGFTADISSAPLEADVAARYRATPTLTFVAGLGSGILGGVGSPLIRAFAGVTWAPVLGDDSDEDGIADEDDACPDKAEDKDGFEDLDGCPDPDNDRDGILDVNDNCPNDPEDFDKFEDEDGCPDPDNDRDGIRDEEDECPTEKEVLNGIDDEDGCPDEGKALVTVEEDRLDIKDRVYFKYDSDEIEETSYPLLNIIVTVLRKSPKMKLRIEGHTDSKGGKRYNKDLSERRAQSVRAYFVQKGIARQRLTAKGYGQSRPLSSNRTDEGRAANRRVEFHIVR